jgi:hypothetical protein
VDPPGTWPTIGKILEIPAYQPYMPTNTAWFGKITLPSFKAMTEEYTGLPMAAILGQTLATLLLLAKYTELAYQNLTAK